MIPKPKKYIILLFLQLKGLYNESYKNYTKYELLNIINQKNLQWDLLNYNHIISRHEKINNEILH
jgi:hypothetical protein